MKLLLWKNLKITLPTALSSTILGYLFSLPMCYVFDYDAARMQLISLPPLPIQIYPEQRIALGKFQAMVTLGGTILGTVVAQTTFVVSALKDRENQR